VKPFAYARPGSAAQAVRDVAAEPQAVFLAGGTNLVDHLKLGVAQPEVVVDVRRLTSRDITDLEDGGLRLGAASTNSEVAADRRVRERYPVLAQALLAGATGQLRNLATTGGNPLQRTRCVYFQDVTTPCNKRQPGSGCSAVGGYTRYHAVLGTAAALPDPTAPETCIATHPSDMAVALAALDARIELHGPGGGRSVAAADFHRLPGEHPEQDTEILPGELITGVVLPAETGGLDSLYRKARDRASYAFALASVAAVLRITDGVIDRAGLAFGALAHRPWRARVAEEVLTGAAPTAAAFERAVDLELSAARPLRDNAYKVPLARNLALDVLARLAEPART
jgi:xanthine dehydrogenase YagS FAD-binding subunit